jgi:hypothetical protein
LRALLLIFSRIIVLLLRFRFLGPLPNSSIRALVGIGGWISSSVLMGVWSHLISVFKKETRFWKIQTKSIVEVFNALKISFLSDLIAIGLGLFLFTLNYAFKFYKQDPDTLLILVVLSMFVSWFYSVPLLYENALVKRKSKTK